MTFRDSLTRGKVCREKSERKSRASSRRESSEKVFHLSVRSDIFVVPQVEVEKVVSSKKMIFFELKRKSGKDL